MEEIQEKNAIVQFAGVELHRNDNTILTDIDIRISEGDFVYLIGKVGSGKSTFLKSLYAEIAVTKGTAKVLDFDLVGLRRKQIPFLRRHIGIVFQDFQLLTDRSVEHNLEFVLRATGWKNNNLIRLRIEEVLEQVGMQNKGYKMPHELSGGEQQRIVIARALLNSPNIILADEPTGNLDPETGNQIVKLLHEISDKGTAIVMSTHNYGIVQRFPGRIVKCEDGYLSEVEQENGI